MQRPWRSALYGLGTNGFLSLLSYTTQDHQPKTDTIFIVSWVLPHKPINKKMQRKPIFTCVGGGNFLN